MYSSSYRRWKVIQIYPAVLSIIAYLTLMSLPAPVGLILMQLFPGWFVTYTPSALLKGFFIKDNRGKLHWADSGQYTSKFFSRIYDLLLFLAMICSTVVGWYSAALNVVSVLTEIQSAIAILVSGNFYGFLMGYYASKNRRIHTGF